MRGSYFVKFQVLLAFLLAMSALFPLHAQKEDKKEQPAAKVDRKEEVKAEPEATDEKPDEEATEADTEKAGNEEEMDEAVAEEEEASGAAVARPVTPDPIQVYGWREKVLIDGIEKTITAKLDTGAYTSSIHAEEKELFERDGKKWVRFIVTEPRKKNSPRVRIEAPLVRIARIKNPGGESETREVVRLAFKLGERKLRGEFTLNDRANMLSAVLIGRTTIKELGWIDPSRTNLADDKIMR